MDLKKFSWNLDEYITYKQVSIYLFISILPFVLSIMCECRDDVEIIYITSASTQTVAVYRHI